MKTYFISGPINLLVHTNAAKTMHFACICKTFFWFRPFPLLHFDIFPFPLNSPSDIVRISELTLILKIIGQPDVRKSLDVHYH
jgi:hypothetical protein